MNECPCCGSKQISTRETNEDLELMECLDCPVPDFYIDESEIIWYGGSSYSKDEFKTEMKVRN